LAEAQCKSEKRKTGVGGDVRFDMNIFVSAGKKGIKKRSKIKGGTSNVVDFYCKRGRQIRKCGKRIGTNRFLGKKKMWVGRKFESRDMIMVPSTVLKRIGGRQMAEQKGGVKL